ncbi:MAG: glycine oxidase ThiO [bacterium]
MTHESSVDSIVIGAGVMGSAIALRLAQAGQRVVVLERAVPGAEASSAAAGILGPQVEAEADGPLFRLALASRERYPAFSEELHAATGHDLGFRRVGVVRAMATEDELEAWLAERAWQGAAGLSVRVVRGAELAEVEPALGTHLPAAVHLADEAQVDAQALALALPEAARRAGARFERAAVLRVRVEGRRVTGVDLDSGPRHAAAVVVAAGAWTGQVVGAALPHDAVSPVRGQMVLLKVEGDVVGPRTIVFGASGYAVPRAQGRVLLGSSMERVGFDKRVTAAGVAGILGHALAILPGLGRATLESTWAGFRPAPRDGLPLIGATHVDGLFVASGHHRNGILLTPITADLVADAVLGRASALDPTPFRPTRFSLDAPG